MKLSYESLAPISAELSLANCEARLITINEVPSVSVVRASELLETLDDMGAYDDGYDKPHVRVLWQMLKEATDRGYLTREDKGFRKTPLGRRACAVGGYMLDISQRTNVATRRIIGHRPDSNAYRNPVITRVLTWSEILSRSPGRVSNAQVVNALMEHGLTDRGAASAVKDMTKAGLVRRDHDPTQPHCTKLGLFLEDSEAERPFTAGREYLDLVAKILTGEVDYSEGQFGINDRIGLLHHDRMLGAAFAQSAETNPYMHQRNTTKGINNH